jgi:hypothetical protein
VDPVSDIRFGSESCYLFCVIMCPVKKQQGWLDMSITVFCKLSRKCYLLRAVSFAFEEFIDLELLELSLLSINNC